MEFNRKLFKERVIEASGGLTQKAIAEKLHRSETMVSNWFNGKTKPHIDDLLDISSAFSCSVDDLLGIRTEKNTHTTAEEFCRAVVSIDSQYEVSITESTDEFLISSIKLSIHKPSPNAYIGEDPDIAIPGIAGAASQMATYEFLRDYNRVKSTHLEADILHTVVNSLLDKVSARENEYYQEQYNRYRADPNVLPF